MPEHVELVEELKLMRRQLVAMPFSATQLALVAIAAQQAFIQDPERNWLPKEFEEDFKGGLRGIDVLTRTTFGLEVQARLREGFDAMDRTGKES